MKRFLVHSAIFLTLIMGSIAFVFFQADGYTDPFYIRFTTPKQNSLIIGTSKAAQGIRPAILKTNLPEHSFFNYAFTVAHSPYGPAYLNGIKRKLSEDPKAGIFIVTVDGWSVSDGNQDPNDASQFDENYSFLNNLTNVSSKPNFGYLTTYYKNNYAKIFERDTVAFLHDDGWLEISTRMSEEIVNTRIENKAVSLAKKLENNRLSYTRLKYLRKTITYLQEHGKVYLVRLPVHPSLADADAAVVPNFKEIMTQLANETGTAYLDMHSSNDQFQYTDGIHLTKNSAADVSNRIGLWIKSNLQEKQ